MFPQVVRRRLLRTSAMTFYHFLAVDADWPILERLQNLHLDGKSSVLWVLQWSIHHFSVLARVMTRNVTRRKNYLNNRCLLPWEATFSLWLVLSRWNRFVCVFSSSSVRQERIATRGMLRYFLRPHGCGRIVCKWWNVLPAGFRKETKSSVSAVQEHVSSYIVQFAAVFPAVDVRSMVKKNKSMTNFICIQTLHSLVNACNWWQKQSEHFLSKRVDNTIGCNCPVHVAQWVAISLSGAVEACIRLPSVRQKTTSRDDDSPLQIMERAH